MAKNRGRKPTAPPAKKPKVSVVPPGGKHPQIAPADGAEAFMTWRFSKVDFGGPWPWDWEAFVRHQPQLREFEAKTWVESDTKGTIGVSRIPIENLPTSATNRLERLKLNDFDLYEIRVTKKSRFWGFRVGHCFHFLWWDPDHTLFKRK